MPWAALSESPPLRSYSRVLQLVKCLPLIGRLPCMWYVNLLATQRPCDKSVRTVVKTYSRDCQGAVVIEPWCEIYNEQRSDPAHWSAHRQSIGLRVWAFPDSRPNVKAPHFIWKRRYLQTWPNLNTNSSVASSRHLCAWLRSLHPVW